MQRELDIALDKLESRAALEGAAFTADEGDAAVSEAVEGLLEALSGEDPSGRFLDLEGGSGGGGGAPAGGGGAPAGGGAYVVGAVAEGATLEDDGDGRGGAAPAVVGKGAVASPPEDITGPFFDANKMYFAAKVNIF